MYLHKLINLIKIVNLIWFLINIGRRRRPSSKIIHSKNTLKTVLARSGAEKNSFLCFWPLKMVKNSYVNSYANYVGYRNYLGYVNVNVTELFSLYTVITDLGITRNSGFLAELA